jgi:hypothetical protein
MGQQVEATKARRHEDRASRIEHRGSKQGQNSRYPRSSLRDPRPSGFIAAWWMLSLSLLFSWEAVATALAVSSDQSESRTRSQTSDSSDRQSAIRESRQSAIELVPGVPIERELASGETHTYRITLTAGQFLRVVVNQFDLDVAVKLVGPNGQQLAEIDNADDTVCFMPC